MISFFEIVIILPISILLILICRNTRFYIKETGVVFRRDFIILSEKNIRYKDIKEVILSQGIFQKHLVIGTVTIKTHATSDDAGIVMYNIKEFRQVYKYLSDIRHEITYG